MSEESKSQRDPVENEVKTTGSKWLTKGVVVIEKEFKSDQTHEDTIKGIQYINESEFLTASLDMQLKVWDKHL